MTETLKDPSMPAGYVFPEDVNEDGSATTNDGRKLKSARTNPWYVLATLFGENTSNLSFGSGGRKKEANRRVWNTWACQGVSDQARAKIAKEIDLLENGLKPLSSEEEEYVLHLFRVRIGNSAAMLPNVDEAIDFSNTYFHNHIEFQKCFFRERANFSGSTFGGMANFSNAFFNHIAAFDDSTFFMFSIFDSARFDQFVDFKSSTFCSGGDFESTKFLRQAGFGVATFNGSGLFNGAKFNQLADFHEAIFQKCAYFKGAKFQSTTNFFDAKFRTRVPAFHGAELFNETILSLPDNHILNWPETPRNQVEALEQKDAYNRLRLFMNQTLQTEAEQFFHRREMACKKALEGSFMFAVYWLYGLLSNYGHSVGRPLVGLFANVGIGWLVFASVFYATSDALNGASHASAFGVSLSNVFAFLGFGRVFLGDFYKTMSADYGMWLVFLSGVQTVLGFILLFLLGLGLRNRFRLR